MTLTPSESVPVFRAAETVVRSSETVVRAVGVSFLNLRIADCRGVPGALREEPRS
jgi:hypothetical protein